MSLASPASTASTPPEILISLFVTVRKPRLGQGNSFTPVCHSVHRVEGLCTGESLSRRGVSVKEGSLCQGEESLSRRGVSVQEGVSVGGSLSGGLCPGGLCPGGSLSRRAVSVQEGGLCVRGGGALSREGLCPG